jgi:acyl-CoA synthetase (AMP-forming)/AMP-acid ligase II
MAGSGSFLRFENRILISIACGGSCVYRPGIREAGRDMTPSVVTVHREVVAALTGPGGPYELERVKVGKRSYRAYRRAPASLEEFLSAAAASFGDRLLLVQEGRAYTYGELFAEARRLAGALQDAFGVAAGDRVGIVMRNRAEYFAALFAVARIGAVAVLYNGRGTAAELRVAVDDVPSAVVIADQARAERLVAGGCAAPLIVVGEPSAAGGDEPGTAADYADLVAPGRREAAAVAVDRDGPAWVLFTSGTSGRAKGAVLTQRNVCNMITNADFLREAGLELRSRLSGQPVAALRERTRPPAALLVYPLFHVSGLSVMTNALLRGGRLVGLRRWDPSAAARAIVAHKVTALSAPPLVLHDLMALPDATEILGGLVQIGAGGQATPANLARRMTEAAPNAAQSGGWGMTETVATVSAFAGPLIDARPGSAGRVVPVMDVRAVDPAGRVLPPGAPGELQVRGVLVMQGYWGSPEQTAAAFDGEWYRTGDVGHVDEDGFVHVVDRLTDMVISGGENIYCAEVERALTATDAFVEVAVFGVPDVRLGERTVAVVRPRDGRTFTGRDVRSEVGEILADYKVPSEVVFVPGPFPRTATGKVEKAKLRAAFLEDLVKDGD